MELNITIESKTTRAAKSHECAYCKGPIKKGDKYVSFLVRVKKKERFPRTVKVCNKHKPELIPIKVLL